MKCLVCNSNGKGELIPGPLSGSAPDTDEYKGRMLILDKWLNGGEDRIYYEPGCGYARSTVESTPNGGPGFIDPISERPIAMDTGYKERNSDKHHTIYKGDWADRLNWPFGDYTVHLHPETHKKIHFDKKLRNQEPKLLKNKIVGMEFEYLVQKVERSDPWDNKGEKVRDLMYISMLCQLWENMDQSHKFYPDTNPTKDQVRFGLLRCGVPPMADISDEFYMVMGPNSTDGTLHPGIRKIENRWEQYFIHRREELRRVSGVEPFSE